MRLLEMQTQYCSGQGPPGCMLLRAHRSPGSNPQRYSTPCPRPKSQPSAPASMSQCNSKHPAGNTIHESRKAPMEFHTPAVVVSSTQGTKISTNMRCCCCCCCCCCATQQPPELLFTISCTTCCCSAAVLGFSRLLLLVHLAPHHHCPAADGGSCTITHWPAPTAAAVQPCCGCAKLAAAGTRLLLAGQVPLLRLSRSECGRCHRVHLTCSPDRRIHLVGNSSDLQQQQ